MFFCFCTPKYTKKHAHTIEVQLIILNFTVQRSHRIAISEIPEKLKDKIIKLYDLGAVDEVKELCT